MSLCVSCLDVKSNCLKSLENTVHFSSRHLGWLKEEEFELMLIVGILLVLYGTGTVVRRGAGARKDVVPLLARIHRRPRA